MKTILTLILLGCLSGCMEAKYGDLTIRKFMWSTNIGHLEAHNSKGDSITIDNYDSESQAIQALRESNKALLQLAPLAAGMAGK